MKVTLILIPLDTDEDLLTLFYTTAMYMLSKCGMVYDDICCMRIELPLNRYIGSYMTLLWLFWFSTMPDWQIKQKSVILIFLEIILLKTWPNKQANGHFISAPSSYFPFTGTANSQKQSLRRIPPTPVHPHVGPKSMSAFLFAIYSQYSPVSSHMVCFSRPSMKKSRRIVYKRDWPKTPQK